MEKDVNYVLLNGSSSDPKLFQTLGGWEAIRKATTSKYLLGSHYFSLSLSLSLQCTHGGYSILAKKEGWRKSIRMVLNPCQEAYPLRASVGKKINGSKSCLFGCLFTVGM